MQFESRVAMPAPRISFPCGRRTNIKSGSSAILIIPPIVIPKPAFFDSPTLRSIVDSTFDITVGMLPKTITQIV